VKDNTDKDSWFSAKSIKVENLNVHQRRYRTIFQLEYDILIRGGRKLSVVNSILFLLHRGTVKVTLVKL
jgi:hypothetical protein